MTELFDDMQKTNNIKITYAQAHAFNRVRSFCSIILLAKSIAMCIDYSYRQCNGMKENNRSVNM